MAEQDDIQLIIKAPNQNIKDQVVKCNLDWTVGELKEYLSEEYPNKPDVLEQRLIYSGHLLHNHLHLRDILRQDESDSNVYNLHLVCNANNPAIKVQNLVSSQNRFNQSNVPLQGASSSISDDTLRNRNMSYAPMQNSYYPPVSAPTPVVSPFTDNSQVLAQMNAMQQMYIYYINQYMQSLNPTPVTTTTSPVFREPFNFQAEGPNVPDIPVQQPANQRMNAQAGHMVEENEDNIANRDWLDHIFHCGRYLLLFCIVFCYTTPERLMIVIVCAVIAFLYHEGWFVRRTRPMPAAAEGLVQAPANEDNNENETPLVNQDNSANENMQEGHEIEAAMDGDDPPHAQNANRVNNNDQILSPFTFIYAFFSSLIPEPPPPVNAN